MRAKRLICSVMSFVLALGMSPTTALAETTSASTTNESETSTAQIEGTAGVDYYDNQVLVAVRGGASALQEATSTSMVARFFGASAYQARSSSFTVSETLASVSSSDIANAAEDLGTTDEVDLDAGKGDMSALSLDDEDDIDIILLECDDVAQTISDLRNIDCVVAAQPNYCYELIDDEDSDSDMASALATAAQSSTTTDVSATATSTDSALSVDSASMSTESVASGTDEPFYSAQWSLQSDESLAESGYIDATSLDVEDAWENGAGNEENGDVVVAVIDSGVDYTHEELAANMWTGGEADWSTALGGGKYGINMISGNASSDPMDIASGHGTHCASTIAAAWNGIGIAGTNNKVDIMAVRAIPGGTATTIPSYNYVITAKENGVNVVAVSNSWGPGYNVSSRDTLLDAIIYKAGKAGIVSVFAVGNAGYDNDLISGFHFNNSNPYLLMVGALTSSGTSVNFSQHGECSVDVYSPGVQVLAGVSTYGVKTGKTLPMNGEYLPWLKSSASSTSEYFFDDCEDSTGPDGVTYDLVAYDNYYNIYHVGDATSLDKGYSNAGVNNNKSIKFSLKDAESAINDGLSPAIRITIPAATWESYEDQEKGDLVCFSAIGAMQGSDYVDPYLKPYVKTSKGWDKLTGALEGLRDTNWYRIQFQTSLTELDMGKGENGEVTLLLMVNGLGKTTFTDDDYVYLDNISLGWGYSSNTGTSSANGTYAYCDGSSMATPNVTGVVSLLCSHAKAASSDPGNYTQTADTAREIVSFIKGGVTRLDSISDLCGTGGAANADSSYAAFKAYVAASNEEEQLEATAELKPVPDNITDNGDGTSTISGSFFGSAEGTVTFKGEKLTVTNWTDTDITFKSLSFSKEQVGKVEVTKANGVSGQDYLILPDGSSSALSFDILSNPDFDLSITYTTESGLTVSIEGNASDVSPVRMVSAGNSIFVYGTIGEEVPVLMRYDVETETWDEKNYLAAYTGKIDVEQAHQTSMAAGVSEIYLKYVTKDKSLRLMTLDITTGTVKYDVKLALKTNMYGNLGFMDGKLYMVGGLQGEPACSAIYPDTGAAYWTPETTLPTNVICGDVTCCGFGFTVTGSYSSTQMDSNGFSAGVRNNQIDIYLPNANDTIVNVSTDIFFPQEGADSNYGLDSGQGFASLGVAAIDGGAIVTGPVRYNEADNMVDTWVYSAQIGTWTAITNTRFAPTVNRWVCACTCNGVYYVMATEQQHEGVTQRFGCFSLAEWDLTDDYVTATEDAAKSDAITTQPESITAKAGEGVEMSVATRGEVASYQWQHSKDGSKWYNTSWTGAQTDTLTFKMISALDARQWRCVVTFADGTVLISDAATTTLLQQQGEITSQPESVSAYSGQKVAMSVDASNAASYKWQHSKDGTHWYTTNWSTSSELSFKMTASLNKRNWRCVVTFEDGHTETSAVATSTLAATPATTVFPRSTVSGAAVTVSIDAIEGAAYQWQHSKDGKTWYDTKWAGHDSASMSFKMLSSLNGRNWRCKITLSDGVVVYSEVGTTSLLA